MGQFQTGGRLALFAATRSSKSFRLNPSGGGAEVGRDWWSDISFYQELLLSRLQAR
jgi:hypothetical protein